MIIERAKSTDYEEIKNVIRIAFENEIHSDKTEHILVENLTKSNSFIEELSLVAKVDGKIVGHIMFTRGFVNDKEVLILAPLSVLPKYQKNKIGTKLINEGHKLSKKLNFKASFVLGSPLYYSKFGYKGAIEIGVKPPFDGLDDFFMVNILDTDFNECGTLKYPDEFGI